MPKPARRFAQFLFVTVLTLLFQAAPLRAQLVGNPGPPPVSQLDGSKQEPSTTAHSEKKRLSKDFTLKGDSHWTDTNIDLQPGEHVVVTAAGKLRYADAKEENGPQG